jgi:hypothetical protein
MSLDHSEDGQIRDRIAQGWTAMLFCLICNQLNALQRDAVLNDFTQWAAEPGTRGIYVLSGIFTIHILMPLFIRSFEGRVFRKIAVACALLLGVVPLVHQIIHAFLSTRPPSWILIFEFVHHAVALWVLMQSVRWMRLRTSSR